MARACPSPYDKVPLLSRSAGACPPRWPSSRCCLRSYSPNSTRAVFFRSSLSVVCDRLITNGSRSGDLDLQRRGGLTPKRCVGVQRRWRGTGPRPTVTRTVFSTVARGPVPRDRWDARGMARGTRSHARVAPEGPRPMIKYRFFSVARGPVPRERPVGEPSRSRCLKERFGGPQHGEGQALALRGKGAVLRP